MPLRYLSAQYGININVRLFQKYLVVTENKNLSSMTASERLALSVVKPTNITIRKNLPESAIPPPLPTDCYATKNQIDKKLKERIDINKDVPEYLSVGAWTGAVDHILPRLQKKVRLTYVEHDLRMAELVDKYFGMVSINNHFWLGWEGYNLHYDGIVLDSCYFLSGTDELMLCPAKFVFGEDTVFELYDKVKPSGQLHIVFNSADDDGLITKLIEKRLNLLFTGCKIEPLGSVKMITCTKGKGPGQC
ncbi:hypothetical protein L596_006639 [Steinernema carpocapsae]|nr:hypothetical protein L596_006639 [Steinernema carpocapsae]